MLRRLGLVMIGSTPAQVTILLTAGLGLMCVSVPKPRPHATPKLKGDEQTRWLNDEPSDRSVRTSLVR